MEVSLSLRHVYPGKEGVVEEGVVEIGSECRDFDLLEVVGDNAAGSQGSGRSTSLLVSSE